MKKLIVTALIAILPLISFGQKIKGSDTMLPLTQRFAEILQKQKPSLTISVIGGGSGVGLTSLIEGSCDIAMASRAAKFSEKQKISAKKQKLNELIVAQDAIAVIVNPKNGVSKLTRQQLEDIFTGKVTNWKDVGGKDMTIVAYSRETSSGTYEFFRENVLDKKNFSSKIMSMPATGAIMKSVAQTAGAIGYVGLAYLDKTVKPISVSYDNGKTYVAPSVKNAKNGTYPIVRPLYYYYTDANSKSIKEFLNFVQSSAGKKIITEEGYIK
jgi:phosphate transport system substrate-binding protein